MKGSQLLQHGAIFITILTAGLYGLGYTYYESYLAYLGFHISQFPLNLHELLFRGFFSAMDMSVSVFSPLMLLGFGIFLISTLSVLLGAYLQETDFVREKILSRIKSNDDNADHRDFPFTVFCANVIVFIAMAVLTIIAIALLMVQSANTGEAYAEKFKERSAAGKYWRHQFDYKNTKETLEGYLVRCSDSQCGFYIDGEARVFDKTDMQSHKIFKPE